MEAHFTTTVSSDVDPTHDDLDRRRGSRHRLGESATLTPESGGPAIAVRMVELSVGGIGITAPEPIAVGSIHLIDAYDTLLPQETRVKIVSVRSLEDEHLMGAEIL